MGATDGKVIISTELDNNGFKKGIGSVAGSLGGLKSVSAKLAAVLATAFSVKALVDFGKASVDATMKLQNAMLGLESVVTGQGRSFTKSQEFINSYVQDGLVPATDAITAFKNLALRGYDDSQIQNVMIALKDSAAFGKQSALTMGEAISSASEGLRNENSILVDNAGVTKNVAKMWDEYARSIGTNAQALTQQQKIQAEVSGIMNETRFQTGDAAKITSTYSGQLMQLSYNMNALKVAFGNAIMPIAQQIIPVINNIINALTRLATAFANVIGYIFETSSKQAKQSAASAAGVNTAIADSVDNQNALTDATQKTAKAQKSLGIDELNVIGEDKAGGGNIDAPSTGGGTKLELEPNTEALEEIPGLIKEINKILDNINVKFAPSIKAWGEAFTGLKVPIKGAFDVISASSISLWNNALVPFYEYITTEFIPNTSTAFSENFAPIFKDIASVAITEFALDFKFACKTIEGVTKDLILPVAKVFEGAFVDACTTVKKNWDEFGVSILTKFSAVREGIRNIWQGLYDNVFAPVCETMATTFAWLWDNHLKKLWDNIVGMALAIGECIMTLWSNVLVPVISWFWDKAGPIIANFVQLVIGLFGTFFAAISDTVGGVLRIFKGLAEFITGVFTLDWRKAWTGIADIFAGVWDAIVGGFKFPINLIIDMLNSLIRSITNGLNGVINMMNSLSFKIPSWVPGFGGKKFGLSIPTLSAPQIPKLANGAVIPANREFLAVLGDQKRGVNIESPLSTIEDALRNVLANQGGMAQSFTVEQPVQLMLDGNVFYEVMMTIQSNKGCQIGGAFANAY